MIYEVVIKVFEKGISEPLGEIKAYDRHYKTGEDMNWLFTPNPDQQLGIDDLRQIANKLEALEPKGE